MKNQSSALSIVMLSVMRQSEHVEAGPAHSCRRLVTRFEPLLSQHYNEK